jgi:hypothetical protein
LSFEWERALANDYSLDKVRKIVGRPGQARRHDMRRRRIVLNLGHDVTTLKSVVESGQTALRNGSL